jgi:glycine dehydrogenase
MRPETPATTFERRHIGPSPNDIEAMLATVNASTLEALIAETVPASIRQEKSLAFGDALSETAAIARMREIASKNQVFTSLIGTGYHGTLLPFVIQRNILENPAWYTAYTPYQPEISQGRLEALLNYQTMICDLTGLDVSNASLLDEATAAAEAMTLAQRAAKSKSTAFFVDSEIHPQSLALITTRAEALGWTVVTGNPLTDLAAADVFGAIFQYPGTHGEIRDYSEAVKTIQAKGGIAIFAADPLALTLLKSPGELGADIAIGSTQRFGVPMGYGGPHAAYMAVKDAYKRSMPGRLVGVSIDAKGHSAYRLALQTREQHIRREKATSNICTAQVLLAVIASMYAVYHGPEGLKHIASTVATRTAVLAAGLRKLGFKLVNGTAFDTVTVEVGDRLAAIVEAARAKRINFRVLEGKLGITLDEATTPELVELVWAIFGGSLHFADIQAESMLPAGLLRSSEYLTHPVFHRYRSETEILRYMRKLCDRDLALDRAMIPLGSCTMKLNATAEMMPVTWPEFGGLHPFAPVEQAAGYFEMFEDLKAKLCEVTGYDAVSLQPNSGAQGEYAGLLAIRGYHRNRGDFGRTVCLIPSSTAPTRPPPRWSAWMSLSSPVTLTATSTSKTSAPRPSSTATSSPPSWSPIHPRMVSLKSAFARSAKLFMTREARCIWMART